MSVLALNAQWFEDNSSISSEHKKKNVKGVSYKVVQVASESGDASPSTPIGVNLPNANWIRAAARRASSFLSRVNCSSLSRMLPSLVSQSKDTVYAVGGVEQEKL